MMSLPVFRINSVSFLDYCSYLKEVMCPYRSERERRRAPYGDQHTTRSASGWNVTRLGMPPVAGTVKTSTLPSYSPVNASVLPSGEKAASLSKPGPDVRRDATPPSRLACQRSPEYENTVSRFVMPRLLPAVVVALSAEYT